MNERKLDHVPLRFSKRDQNRLRRILDPDQKISPQLRELIFEAGEARLKKHAEPPPDNLRLEEKLDKVTSILAMLAERFDELEAEILKVGKDAARSKMVIENIQDHLADEPGC